MNTYPTYPYMQNYPTYPQYQQPIQQVVQQPITQPQTQQNISLFLVQTEDEARNYPTGINTSNFFMNENQNYLYIKSVDSAGKTLFVKKKLEDEGDSQETQSEYVKKEEIEEIISDRIQKEVEKRFSEISFKPTKKKTVVVDED